MKNGLLTIIIKKMDANGFYEDNEKHTFDLNDCFFLPEIILAKEIFISCSQQNGQARVHLVKPILNGKDWYPPTFEDRRREMVIENYEWPLKTKFQYSFPWKQPTRIIKNKREK